MAAPVATGGPVLHLDLATEIDRLRRESCWSGGRDGKTLLKHGDFRLVLVVARPGVRTRPHRVRGSVAVQVLEGRLRVQVLDEIRELTAGQMLALDPNFPHGLDAMSECAFLLSIAWPGEPSPSTRRARRRAAARAALDDFDWERDESVWN